MSAELAGELAERLICYCRIDTQADESSTTCPSTEQQFDRRNALVEAPCSSANRSSRIAARPRTPALALPRLRSMLPMLTAEWARF